MNNGNNITEAQVFLTRECNLSCGYCNLVGRKLEELDFDGWKRAFARMAAIGIKTVKFLGGEPTVKPWLPELIAYAGDLNLKTALLSNSSFDDDMFRRLVDNGLWAYYASVDGLGEIDHYDEQTAGKARGGYAMLKRMQRHGVPLLAANTVIHRKNYPEVPALVRRLSEEGFYINLCTVQHNDEGGREFSKADTGKDVRFFEEDREELERLSSDLLELYRQGALLSVPERYIVDIPKYGIGCDWQCTDMVQLRIDADGGTMLCNEYRTELAEKYNIADQQPSFGRLAWWDSLRSDWQHIRKDLNCSGCYWSCFIQAEENLLNGRLEFDFMHNNMLKSTK